MCPPHYYAIQWQDPALNPWMNQDCQPDMGLAKNQYEGLKRLYRKLGVSVFELEPRQELGDQVFTANVAWGVDRTFIMANLKPERRRPEAGLAGLWFVENRFNVHFLPEHIYFEGQGDIITTKEAYLYCYGIRNSLEAAEEIERLFKFKKPILPLKLKDPRAYHGDLSLRYSKHRDAVLFYPGAFDNDSIRRIEKLKVKSIKAVGDDFIVQEVRDGGRNFPLNGCYIGNVETFPWNDSCGEFPREIRSWVEAGGGEVALLDFSQFGLSGAGHRCVTLFLD